MMRRDARIYIESLYNLSIGMARLPRDTNPKQSYRYYRSSSPVLQTRLNPQSSQVGVYGSMIRGSVGNFIPIQ